jgi:trimeric autotransporter adhesin
MNRSLLLPTLLLATTLCAQAPQRLSYQAVVRNTADALVTNAAVGMRISILQGSANGPAVYVETHSGTTNDNGLLTLEVGGGTVVSGNFGTINWGANSYWMRTEADPDGGTSYTISGTSQLLSVPYALHAATAGGGGGSFTAGTGLSWNGSTLNALTTAPIWNANALLNIPVSGGAPALNNVLLFNGTAWVPGMVGGSGTTVDCSTSFNTNYTIRGTGSGGWECTDAIWVTSTDRVGIGTTSPSSSFDLNIGTGGFLVDGSTTTSNIAGKLRVGGTTSTSYDLQVDGQGYITNGLRVGTTSTPNTGGILANSDIETNTRFVQGSSTSGTGTVMVRTSSGELRPQSSTLRVKTNVAPLRVDKDRLFALRPVEYDLKPALGGGHELGLIAEEVEQVLPELVIHGPARTWTDDSGIPATDAQGRELVDATRTEPYSVHYDRLAVLLLQVVKEQEQRIAELERRLAETGK